MKNAFVRQKDAMQCGTACLAMLCRHYGYDIGIDEIERLCPSSRDGVSLLAISETATGLGLENATAKMSVDRLSEMPLPCILHWNQNHFVVLCKVSKNGKHFFVADPGVGHVRYSRSEFASRWAGNESGKGIAMLLQPTPDFFKNREKRRQKKRTLRFILGYMAKYKRLTSPTFCSALP